MFFPTAVVVLQIGQQRLYRLAARVEQGAERGHRKDAIVVPLFAHLVFFVFFFFFVAVVVRRSLHFLLPLPPYPFLVAEHRLEQPRHPRGGHAVRLGQRAQPAEVGVVDEGVAAGVFVG